MNQSTNFVGQHLFGQITILCNLAIIGPVIRATNANRYYKRLHFYEHFISMLYCTLSGCTSLREISAGLGVAQGKLNHLGIDYVPPRSTLSDGNRQRPSDIFKETYSHLYKCCFINDALLLQNSTFQNAILTNSCNGLAGECLLLLFLLQTGYIGRTRVSCAQAGLQTRASGGVAISGFWCSQVKNTCCRLVTSEKTLAPIRGTRVSCAQAGLQTRDSGG